jgi:hypothetical protein
MRCRPGLPDCVLAPSNVVSGAKAVVRWRQARVLQLIPDFAIRDHVPLYFVLSYWYAFGSAWKQELPFRWDKEKLASCLQVGQSRVAFLEDLQEKLCT